MGAQVTGVSFDLFGTLLTADRPDAPAEALAHALDERGVSVPDDWTTAFGSHQIDAPDGAAVPLTDHVLAALASRSSTLDRASARPAVERAVRSTFDPAVQTREGAATTVDRLSGQLPVGVLSNCSVRGLAGRALRRSRVDTTALDVVTTSVGCGWRKPDARAFGAVADGLGVGVEHLLHVGDDPVADGRAVETGAMALLVDETSLPDVHGVVEGCEWG